MSKWDNNALIIDTSHWTSAIDWKTIKAAGVAAVWAKCSEGTGYIDDKFAPTVQAGYDNNIPVLAYHFFDPAYLKDSAWGEEHWTPFNTNPNDFTSVQDLQLLNLKRALKNKKVYGIAIDLERWWIDYTDYRANGGNAKRIPSSWINALVIRFADAVRKTWPTLEVYIYSRASFIKDYVPEINKTGVLGAQNYPIWTAEYYQPAKSVTLPSWDELKNYYPADHRSPVLWGGVSKWTIWQWSGDVFMLPGMKEPVDLNFYNGTKEEFYQAIGFTPKEETPEPEQPEPEPETMGLLMVNNSTMNIRSGPGVNYPIVGMLPQGLTVEPLDVAGTNAWIKTSAGWVCAQLGNTKYMTVK